MSRKGQGRKELWRTKLFLTFWEIQNPKCEAWSPGWDINSGSGSRVSFSCLFQHIPCDPWGLLDNPVAILLPLPTRTFQTMLDPCLFAQFTEDKTEAGSKECAQSLFPEPPSPALPHPGLSLSLCHTGPLRDAGMQEDSGSHHAQPGSFPLHCQRVLDPHPVCSAGIRAGSRGCCRV